MKTWINWFFDGSTYFLLSGKFYRLCYGASVLSLFGFVVHWDPMMVAVLVIDFALVGGCSHYAVHHLKKQRAGLKNRTPR